MQYLGFAFAFAVIGLAAGFMVAASESPVVAAALPVLAGLATAVIAAVSGRINSDELMKRLEGLKSLLASTPQQVSERTISAFVDTNRAIMLHARETTQALGALTLCFGVFFVVGLGLGMWSRLASAPVRVLSPLAGPWTIGDDDGATATAMPTSAAAALLWLRLEQQLRAAGVPRPTIRALYEAHVAETIARAQDGAGGAQPTDLDYWNAWHETVGSFGDLGGALAGGGPAPGVGLPVVGPGVGLHREFEDVVRRLQEIQGAMAEVRVGLAEVSETVSSVEGRFGETQPYWEHLRDLRDLLEAAPRSGVQGMDLEALGDDALMQELQVRFGQRGAVVVLPREDAAHDVPPWFTPGALQALPVCSGPLADLTRECVVFPLSE